MPSEPSRLCWPVIKAQGTSKSNAIHHTRIQTYHSELADREFLTSHHRNRL